MWEGQRQITGGRKENDPREPFSHKIFKIINKSQNQSLRKWSDDKENLLYASSITKMINVSCTHHPGSVCCGISHA